MTYIRPFDESERQRAAERARINSHDAFMDFPPVKPSLTVEERLDEIEDLLEAMCEDLTIQHMLEVRMMRNKAKRVKKDDSVVYDVKANYK
jgi:hypothetical protein